MVGMPGQINVQACWEAPNELIRQHVSHQAPSAPAKSQEHARAIFGSVKRGIPQSFSIFTNFLVCWWFSAIQNVKKSHKSPYFFHTWVISHVENPMKIGCWHGHWTAAFQVIDPKFLSSVDTVEKVRELLGTNKLQFLWGLLVDILYINIIKYL